MHLFYLLQFVEMQKSQTSWQLDSHSMSPLIVLILQTVFWSHFAWPKGLMNQVCFFFTFRSERDCLLGATGILLPFNSPQRDCFTVSPWAVLPSACFSPHPLIFPGISIMTLSQRKPSLPTALQQLFLIINFVDVNGVPMIENLFLGGDTRKDLKKTHNLYTHTHTTQFYGEKSAFSVVNLCSYFLVCPLLCEQKKKLSEIGQQFLLTFHVKLPIHPSNPKVSEYDFCWPNS